MDRDGCGHLDAGWSCSSGQLGAPDQHDPDGVDGSVTEKFIEEITGGDDELGRFLARMAGLTLVGEQLEQAWFFLYGVGANGKTVFAQTLMRVLGDYAKQAASDLLLFKCGSSHPTDLASLHGVRFAVCSEVPPRQRFDEARIKQLTGGDMVSARRMHEDFWEFKPKATLMVLGNDRPRVFDPSDGFWRRLFLVPFTVTIPEEKRESDLMDKLMLELPGILNWAVAGLADHGEHDLQPPSTVRAASDDYRGNEDFMGQFISECCTEVDNGRVKKLTLYAVYCRWAEQQNLNPLSQPLFSKEMQQRGFENGRATGGCREWRGLTLSQTARDRLHHR